MEKLIGPIFALAALGMYWPRLAFFLLWLVCGLVLLQRAGLI